MFWRSILKTIRSSPTLSFLYPFSVLLKGSEYISGETSSLCSMAVLIRFRMLTLSLGISFSLTSGWYRRVKCKAIPRSRRERGFFDRPERQPAHPRRA